ncbi:MYXO-CTERM domain-containing protein [Actinomadura citrea]|uniref:MYXO-CTERM domain-containing protein n=1 Tax=Actinomadura citrea TaxID=46158 RepID=A0A7Y9KFN3_9ACTN|nr:MYXO-CTERM domain-containing protein [Actinomadura citrea]
MRVLGINAISHDPAAAPMAPGAVGLVLGGRRRR